MIFVQEEKNRPELSEKPKDEIKESIEQPKYPWQRPKKAVEVVLISIKKLLGVLKKDYNIYSVKIG